MTAPITSDTMPVNSAGDVQKLPTPHDSKFREEAISNGLGSFWRLVMCCRAILQRDEDSRRHTDMPDNSISRSWRDVD